MKDAIDVTKLVKTAVRTMVNELKAERAIVLLNPDQLSNPVPAAQYGFSTDEIWSDESVPTKVIRYVLEKKKSIYLADATKDDRIDSDACNPCVICVPLREGFLYCDHSKPGGLDKRVRETLQQVAREFDQRYGELTGSGATQKRKTSVGYPDIDGDVVFKKQQNVGDCLTLVRGVTLVFFTLVVGVFLWIMSL